MGSKNCVLMTCFKISVTGCRIATMKNSSCVTNNKLIIIKKRSRKYFKCTVDQLKLQKSLFDQNKKLVIELLI